MTSNIDEARKVADEFKKEGHFDKLKQDILSQELRGGDVQGTIEQVIRDKVATVVKDMVAEDENLIFKNRGSTSALIESQIFKDGYKKLGEGQNGVNVEDYIHDTLNDPLLSSRIKEKLQQMIGSDIK